MMLLSPGSLKDPQHCPQRSPLWFQQRRLRISASEVPKLLGQSKYGNSASVLADKRQGCAAAATSQAQQYGIDNEHLAVTLFQQSNPGLVHTCQETGLWVHPDDPWLCASPDRILTLSDGSKALLEVKCFFMDPGKEIPNDIRLQVCSFVLGPFWPSIAAAALRCAPLSQGAMQCAPLTHVLC